MDVPERGTAGSSLCFHNVVWLLHPPEGWTTVFSWGRKGKGKEEPELVPISPRQAGNTNQARGEVSTGCGKGHIQTTALPSTSDGRVTPRGLFGVIWLFQKLCWSKQEADSQAWMEEGRGGAGEYPSLMNYCY